VFDLKHLAKQIIFKVQGSGILMRVFYQKYFSLNFSEAKNPRNSSKKSARISVNLFLKLKIRETLREIRETLREPFFISR
jgi:hypothetical protein